MSGSKAPEPPKSGVTGAASMSGEISPAGDAAASGDPSMEDILASIRRILSDDEAEQATAITLPPAETPSAAPPSQSVPRLAAANPLPRPEPGKDVLALDARMIVEEPRVASAPMQLNAPASAAAAATVAPADASQTAKPPLVAPEAAAAAASSVGALLRTLVAGREQVAVFRGGPTIEDLVREEIRPLLKQWLDDQLPLLVERLVRAEIERVVGRVGG
jgi:uncharacterized protein